VQIQACGKTQFDTVRNGGSYLSRNDPRLHFGLGACATVERITIKWPRGGTQTVTGLEAGKYHVIVEETAQKGS
jgi:hypothetical protein